MSEFTFEIFGVAIASSAVLCLIVRKMLKVNNIQMDLISKRLESTELRMMRLDQQVDKWGAHFDKCCDDMKHSLKELNSISNDINLGFAVLEARSQERLKMVQPTMLTAKRPYRRRQQNEQTKSE